MTMMKAFCAFTAMTVASSAFAGSAAEPVQTTHRYMIERTFPPGALDGVDAAAKKKVNANKTKTYCVYDGPSEAAVREAAKLSGMPVDNVTEIPNDIKAEPKGAVQKIAAGYQRYLVKRSGAPVLKPNTEKQFGVTLITSYSSADHRDTYWVYEAPSYSAVESAAKASGAPFESIAEIPETLYPN